MSLPAADRRRFRPRVEPLETRTLLACSVTAQGGVVTVRGDNVQLRAVEGLRSVVDADLALRGNVKAPTLGGSVVVKDALYTRTIDAPESQRSQLRPASRTTGMRRASTCCQC